MWSDTARPWLVAGVAVLVAGLLALGLVALRPLDYLTGGVPAAEELSVERAVLDAAGIHLTVRNGGPSANTIAQVQVDGAWRAFTQAPDGPLPRLGRARVDIPYPWIEGETHHVVLLSGAGVAFEHTIEVAVAAPRFTWAIVAGYVGVGLVVGVVPVALGMALFPLVRRSGPVGLDFVLALTLGLLVFLLVDTLQEGLEAAGAAATAYNAPILVWLTALATFLALLAVGRRGGRPPEGVALATFVALGIGLHNLGEGLAIGAAFAIGEVALASFLVLGFALHNVTEGIAIAAPLDEAELRLRRLIPLALLAGLPAVVGTFAGGFAYAPLPVALAFAIGAGAILQVVVEVGAYLARRTHGRAGTILSPSNAAGFVTGLAVMYVTALAVTG